jgi:hypothetical protein
MSRTGEGFPRPLNNMQPACLRSKAKGCSLTRPTMSSRSIQIFSDSTTGNGEHPGYRNWELPQTGL